LIDESFKVSSASYNLLLFRLFQTDASHTVTGQCVAWLPGQHYSQLLVNY